MFNSSAQHKKEEENETLGFQAIEETGRNLDFFIPENIASSIAKTEEDKELSDEYKSSESDVESDLGKAESDQKADDDELDLEHKPSPSFTLLTSSPLDFAEDVTEDNNDPEHSSNEVHFETVEFNEADTRESLENALKQEAQNNGLTSVYDYAQSTEESPKLVPMIFHNIGVYWLAYSLAILACVLCLFKVYQVQETRDLVARYNEVQLNNEVLEKDWLNLVATRQNLSENAKVREYAVNKLQMVSPKTENEKVISLH